MLFLIGLTVIAFAALSVFVAYTVVESMVWESKNTDTFKHDHLK